VKLSEFNFDLPEERIARFPSRERSHSRLMMVRRDTGEITHHIFSDLPDLLGEKDFLVMNNTRVDPVRIFAEAGEKKIELLIIERLSEDTAEVFALPAKKLKVGTRITLKNGAEGEVLSIGDRGRRRIRFSLCLEDVMKIGFAPLPPYIKRKFGEAEAYRNYDLERYQTVYSRNPGSIAAPTAGLHFDEEMIAKIAKRNEMLEVNLSVGAATFQQIEVENIRDHTMGVERIEINRSVASRISDLKARNRALVAVGTTTVRSLESYACMNPAEEEFVSRLFISPGFRFRLVDKLITNFHLPRSSLFILVSAFAGKDLMKKAYGTAVENEYNFFSYGDAMFII